MKILMFCDFELPNQCANSTRVMNFAKLLVEKGHKVSLLGVTLNKELSLYGEEFGIPFCMLRAGNWTGIRAYKRINSIKKYIHTYLQDNTDFDAIILSNVYYDYTREFFKYAKKNSAKLIVNAVEWYDKNSSTFKGLGGKIKFIKNRIALKRIFVKMKNILAISSLLGDYYAKKACVTTVIPTIIDNEEYNEIVQKNKEYSDTINVSYAGDPAKKDYVINAIYALEYLTEQERQRIRLNFYGTTNQKLIANGIKKEILDKYSQNVVCHGRIPYAQVKEKIASADFTVLLRPNKRYANAGFPTKVGESMACGTPVIANLTSDLDKYVINGQTGLVCTDETPKACAEAFKKALALTVEQKQQMRKHTLEMAKSGFDYRSYKEQMEEFLGKLK